MRRRVSHSGIRARIFDHEYRGRYLPVDEPEINEPFVLRSRPRCISGSARAREERKVRERRVVFQATNSKRKKRFVE